MMNPEIRPYTAPLDNYRAQEMEDEPSPHEELEGALERFLAQELGNSPFNLELNAASFNYMSKEELQEILDKVLETVNPEKMETIYIAQNKTEHIMDFLEILSYPMVTETDDPSAKEVLKSGIESGDVNILTSLMAWLLANLPRLQTRAYLAKFLTRLQIPDEIFFEDDVLALYTQYEAEMTKFKTTLKRREALTHKKPLTEVKDDAVLIQQDIDCLRRKIELAKTKVQQSKNYDEETIDTIRNLRFQKQKQFDFTDQEASEVTRERQMADRLDYLKKIFRDLYSSNQCLTAKSLLERQKQEIIAARDIVEVKLPKCIAQLRRKIKSIKTVIEDPPRTVNDLENTKRSIQVIGAETKRLEAQLKVIKSQEVIKEIQVAKSHAEITRRRRNELRDEFQSLEETYEKGKTALTAKSVEVLKKRQRTEDDHDFVMKLRTKAKAFKDRKAELHALRKEMDVVEKTHETLKMDLANGKIDKCFRETVASPQEQFARTNNLDEEYAKLRVKLGQAAIDKKKLDEKKQATMATYTENITLLHRELEERKGRLKPLVQMVTEFQKQTLLLEMECSHVKKKLVEVQKPQETQHLELEISNFEKVVYDEELEIARIQMDLKFKRLELERANEENCSTGRRHSFKQRVLGKIVEQERVHRVLIQEEAELGRNEQENELQQQLFNDLHRLLKFKKSALLGTFSEK